MKMQSPSEISAMMELSFELKLEGGNERKELGKEERKGVKVKTRRQSR